MISAKDPCPERSPVGNRKEVTQAQTESDPGGVVREGPRPGEEEELALGSRGDSVSGGEACQCTGSLVSLQSVI